MLQSSASQKFGDDALFFRKTDLILHHYKESKLIDIEYFVRNKREIY